MSNFGDAVQEYYVSAFRANRIRRRTLFEQIDTPEKAEKYVAAVRSRLRDIYRLPREKTPLNLQRGEIISGPDFDIEKIIFFSRPDFPVTALLYHPHSREKQAPGILMLCGHSNEAKASPYYQAVSASLAAKGCYVLTPDPLGQGERGQYEPEEGLFNVWEHNAFNRRLKPLGRHFGEYRLWDAIRGIDCLLEIPEVDADRIGVTGNSGGGTMTALLNACDDRLAAAAPGCYITTWLANTENELPADAEQIPPGAAANGGEMADFLIAAAPRPVLIMGQKNDFFDIRGTREAYEEVRHIYSLLGAENRVEMEIGPRSHGYSIELRERAYDFFCKTFHLKSDSAEPASAAPRPSSELLCTPEGRTLKLPGTRTMHDLIGDELAEVAARRPRLTADELREALRQKLDIGAITVPHYRQLRSRNNGDLIVVSRFAVECDSEVPAVLQLWSTQEFFHLPEAEQAELYLPHQESLRELAERPHPAPGCLHFALDYRGVGESMASGGDQDNAPFFALYRSDYFYDSLGMLLGESYFGRRVYDVLATAALLESRGIRNLTLTASGIGRYVAIFAAFLAAGKLRLRLETPPPTYAELTRKRFSPLPQSMIPLGILELTDTDDLLTRICNMSPA